MMRAALTPPWVIMADSALPKSWAEAGKIAVGNLTWILPLAAVERAFEEHYVHAGIAFILWIVDLAVAIHLGTFDDLRKPTGRRRLAFILIAAGTFCLAAGIYLLSQQAPSTPVAAMPTPVPTAAPPPKPRYVSSDFDKMLPMLAHLREVLDQKSVPGVANLQRLGGPYLEFTSVPDIKKGLDEALTKIDESDAEIKKIVAQSGIYSREIAPTVADERNTYQALHNELAGAISVFQQLLNNNYPNPISVLSPQLQHVRIEAGRYETWARQSVVNVNEKDKILREWKND